MLTKPYPAISGRKHHPFSNRRDGEVKGGQGEKGILCPPQCCTLGQWMGFAKGVPETYCGAIEAELLRVLLGSDGSAVQ